MTNTLQKETSKLLADLGIKQDSLFVWYRQQGTREWEIELKSEVEKIPLNFEIISAPSLSELFQSLEAIGKVMGWSERAPIRGSLKPRPYWTLPAHQILDHFLTGGMEAVDSYVGELLK